MILYLALLIGTIVMSATLGSVYMKKGSKNILSPWLIAGLGYHFMAGVVTILALKRADLSFVVPFGALTYVLVTIASKYFYNENISKYKIIGLTGICLGVILVGLSL